jgi:hypothetical protein
MYDRIKSDLSVEYFDVEVYMKENPQINRESVCLIINNANNTLYQQACRIAASRGNEVVIDKPKIYA